MRRWLRRGAIALGAIVGLAAIAAALPIGYVETACRAPGIPASRPPPLVPDAGYQRAEGDSYMTYPEWYIVHAYADLADVTRQSSESRFDYASSIDTFWTSLCGATRTAGAIGPVTSDQRITDYIIGISFSVEMGVQGLWERTIGAFTAWTRGNHKTAEDRFNQQYLDHYAVFLQQTPWYAYPFKDELVRFWQQTPFQPSLRSLERRVALSLEFVVKGLYAVGIGALAGVSPADLTMMSVVAGDHALEVPGVTLVRKLDDGRLLVRTPRYGAYTTILQGWAKNGTKVVEIAGNQRILATIIAPKGRMPALPAATPIFTIPLQARPGFERVGLDLEVTDLPDTIAAVARQDATFEHAYDY